MYIEASGKVKGEKARMVYTFDSPVQKGCFSLYFHMYGADIGSLNIGRTIAGGKYEQLWVAIGEQGRKWLQAVIPIQSETVTVSLLCIIMCLQNATN